MAMVHLVGWTGCGKNSEKREIATAWSPSRWLGCQLAGASDDVIPPDVERFSSLTYIYIVYIYIYTLYTHITHYQNCKPVYTSTRHSAIIRSQEVVITTAGGEIIEVEVGTGAHSVMYWLIRSRW